MVHLLNFNALVRGVKSLRFTNSATMHPYSEYLQEYIYNKHSLQDGGSLKNDFRGLYTWSFYAEILD
jgi:hypothetical protein